MASREQMPGASEQAMPPCTASCVRLQSEPHQGRDAGCAKLGRDLLIREMGDARTFTCMFERETTNVAPLVQVKQRVFIKIFGFGYLNRTKLNVQRVSLLEICDLHRVNLRSKKALWTVSPSGSKMTRKYLPPRLCHVVKLRRPNTPLSASDPNDTLQVQQHPPPGRDALGRFIRRGCSLDRFSNCGRRCTADRQRVPQHVATHAE